MSPRTSTSHPVGRADPQRHAARPSRSRRSVLSGAALVGVLLAAAPSAAAGAEVEQPLQTLTKDSSVITAAGNGKVAWLVQDAYRAQGDPRPMDVWTVRDGAPVKVATLTDEDLSTSPRQLEVGVAKDGTPVAIVATAADPGTRFRLVRLDTGAVRELSATRRGLEVAGIGVDSGRYYYTVHGPKTTRTSTSSLWRATLTGTSVGRATKIRTSRRGERWEDVVADRNRVAVRVAKPVNDGTGVFLSEQWAFGTPRGTWRRAGLTYASDGGYEPVTAAFTQDRKSLVTMSNNGKANGVKVTRTPIGTGKASSVNSFGTPESDVLLPTYDPASGRLLITGTDATGATAVGFSPVVTFP